MSVTLGMESNHNSVRGRRRVGRWNPPGAKHADQPILIVLSNGHPANIPDRLFYRIFVFVQRNASVFPHRIAGQGSSRLRLTKAAGIHDDRVSDCANKGSMRMTHHKYIRLDTHNFRLPLIGVLRTVSEEGIRWNRMNNVEA